MEPLLSPTNVDVFRHFAWFVNGRLSTGRDVLLNERFYLSRDAKREYWTRRKVLAALRAQLPSPSVAVEIIQDGYLGVFSTLAYCQHISHLKQFFISPSLHDDHFPLSRPPVQWPTAPIADKLFSSIRRDQSLFFPLIFDRRRLVDHPVAPDRVLPITDIQVLREGDEGEASVYKIKVDPAYNKLVGKVSGASGIIVICAL